VRIGHARAHVAGLDDGTDGADDFPDGAEGAVGDEGAAAKAERDDGDDGERKMVRKWRRSSSRSSVVRPTCMMQPSGSRVAMVQTMCCSPEGTLSQSVPLAAWPGAGRSVAWSF
jgi:hypothetical protein